MPETIEEARAQVEALRQSGRVAPRITDAMQAQVDAAAEEAQAALDGIVVEDAGRLYQAAMTQHDRTAFLSDAADRLVAAWEAGKLPANPSTRAAVVRVLDAIGYAEQYQARHDGELKSLEELHDSGPEGYDRFTSGGPGSPLGPIRRNRFSW